MNEAATIQVSAEAPIASTSAEVTSALQRDVGLGPLTGLLSQNEAGEVISLTVAVGARSFDQPLEVTEVTVPDQGARRQVFVARSESAAILASGTCIVHLAEAGEDCLLRVDLDLEPRGWLRRAGRGAVADWLMDAVRQAAAKLEESVAEDRSAPAAESRAGVQGPTPDLVPVAAALPEDSRARTGTTHRTETWADRISGAALGLVVGLVVGRWLARRRS